MPALIPQQTLSSHTQNPTGILLIQYPEDAVESQEGHLLLELRAQQARSWLGHSMSMACGHESPDDELPPVMRSQVTYKVRTRFVPAGDYPSPRFPEMEEEGTRP